MRDNPLFAFQNPSISAFTQFMFLAKAVRLYG
jgi:hypothetical protein